MIASVVRPLATSALPIAVETKHSAPADADIP
jgi:hypothetical protein